MGQVYATYRQVSFQGYEDDAVLESATSIAGVNTDFDWQIGVPFRLRFLIYEYTTGITKDEDLTLQLEYNLNSGGWTVVGDSNVACELSSYFANQDNTSQLIGSGTYISTNGWAVESGSSTGTATFSDLTECEVVFNIKLGTGISSSDTLQFRVAWNTTGTPLDDYANTPTVTATSGSVSGTLNKTLGTMTCSSTGDVTVTGSTSKTLGAMTCSSTGDVTVTGSTSKTLGTMTCSSAGSVTVTGSTSKTLGAMTCSATGVIPTDYYVSSTNSNRSDSNAGTDPNYPWETMDKVKNTWNASGFNAGDTIHLEKGSSWTVTITSGQYFTLGAGDGGAEGLPITMRGDDYGSGDKPVITRTGATGNCTMFYVSSTCSYVSLKSIKFDGGSYTAYGSNGFAVYANTQTLYGFEVVDCDFVNLGGSSADYISGISFASASASYGIEDVLVEGNIVTNYAAHGLRHSSQGHFTNFVWRNNVVTNNYANRHSSCRAMSFNANSTDCIIEGNVFADGTCAWANVLFTNGYGDDGTGNVFRNNIIRDSNAMGLYLQAAGTGYKAVWDIYGNVFDSNENYGLRIDAGTAYTSGSVFNIYNNTFYNNGYVTNDSAIRFQTGDSNLTVNLKNNILHHPSASSDYALVIDSGVTSVLNHTNNLYWCAAGSSTACINDKGTAYTVANATNFEATAQKTDPLLDDPSNDSFAIPAASDAVDNGTDLGLGDDIGAYQLVTGTGSLSKTLGAMTCSATGTVTAGTISCVLDKTLGAMTCSASGDVAITGTTSKTLGDMTCSSTGTVNIVGSASNTFGILIVSSTAEAPVDGMLSQTLGALTLSGEAGVSVEGTASNTLGDLTVVSNGNVIVEGSSSNALGDLTSSASGTVAIEAISSTTLDPLTLSADGSVIDGISASLDQTLGTMTSSASGTVDVQGSTDVTLGVLTCSSTGTVDIEATASNTLGAMTLTSAGSVIDGVVASLDQTLGTMTSSASGTVDIEALASNTLDALTSSSTGTVDITGTASNTLGAMTTTADGNVIIEGTASNTLGDLTTTADGNVIIEGTASNTLGAMTLSADGSVIDGISASLDQTLGVMTASSSGTVEVDGSANITFGAVTSSSTGVVDIEGSTNTTLGVLTVDSTGTVSSNVINGSLDQTLGSLTVLGSGEITVQGSTNASFGAMTSSSSVVVIVDGSCGVTFGGMTCSAECDVIITGAVTVTLEPLDIVGTGTVSDERTAILDITFGVLTLTSAGVQTRPRPSLVVGQSNGVNATPLTDTGAVSVPASFTTTSDPQIN